MSLTIDDKGLYTGIDRLLARIIPAAEDGLAEAAALMQDDMQATSAHGDMSGATRASYRAFVIGGSHTGQAEAASGYAAAQQALTGFRGHAGNAQSLDSGITLGDDERGILLTSYTSYQHVLETARAGEKAVLGPALIMGAPSATRFVAQRTKTALG